MRKEQLAIIFPGKRRKRSSTLAAVIALVFTASSFLFLAAAGGMPTSQAVAHHRVATKSVDAQRKFDEGLTLLYAFNPEEALAHFQQAGRFDSALAMAYWGIAMSAGPNVNVPYDFERASVGRQAAAEAALLGGGSDEEKRLIAAVAKRYASDDRAHVSAMNSNYADAMADVARRYPNDLDVATLYAESLMDLTPLDMWTRDGKPRRDTERVIDLLRSVLRRNPSHIGANHYLIHAYEGSSTPGAALESARRLADMTFEPAAEHLAHMPAHIFMRVGDFDSAIRSSSEAVSLSRTYLSQEPNAPHAGYFHHDLQVLNWAYCMSGQWAKAQATVTEIAAQVEDSEAAVETYVRFRRWNELLQLPRPAKPGLRWRFARGMALAQTGQTGAAGSELKAIRDSHNTDPRTSIARLVLDAAIAAQNHQRSRAVTDLYQAVNVEDTLAEAEPPKWFFPVRESLGAALLMDGKDRAAQAVFEKDLERNPGNGRSLFGLEQALSRTDRRVAKVRAAFARAWRYADTRLTLAQL